MASPWWSEDTVAVVTGANKGIGFEIVRQLAEQGLTVVLTARDRTRGQAAVNELNGKGLKRVVFHQLDVLESKSVATLAVWLKSEYGGIDILINNAGVETLNVTYESAKQSLGTNYYGVKKVTTSLLRLMRPSAAGARIVNMSSRSGLYERLQSDSVKGTFRDEENYTEEVADSLAAQYLEDVNTGRADDKWVPVNGAQAYSESKMFLNVYVIALAKSLAKSQKEGQEIFVAGICPGATLTEMMQRLMGIGLGPPESMPMKSLEEGADTAVWLALLPKEEWVGKSGKFFGERTEFPFGWKVPPF